MPTRFRITSLAMTALASGLVAGCGSTPEPAEADEDTAPLTEPAATSEPTQEPAETGETAALADATDAAPATETAEPVPSDENAFQGSVPAWFSDEPFELDGKLAVSASGTARTVRDARRAAVDAALEAFDTAARAQDMTEGGRVRQTTVAPLPEGGFVAYVLVAAER